MPRDRTGDPFTKARDCACEYAYAGGHDARCPLALQARADAAEAALRNHLCPHDMADWLACAGDHGSECAVCDEADKGQHRHALLVRAEAAEAKLAAVEQEQDEIRALVEETRAAAREAEASEYLHLSWQLSGWADRLSALLSSEKEKP